MYSTQIITSIKELTTFIPEWLNFVATKAQRHTFSQNPTVFTQELFKKDSKSTTPLVLVIKEKNTIQCIVPCFIERKKFNLSFSVLRLPAPKMRFLTIQGNDLIYSLDVDFSACCETVFATLRKIKSNYDIIYFDEIETQAPLWVYMKTHFTKSNSFFHLSIASMKTEVVSRHIKQKTDNNWLNSLPAKRRKDFKYQINKFNKRAPQPVEIERIDQTSQIETFLNNVEKIDSSTWQTKTFGKQQRNTEKENSYYKMLASNGWLRSYILKCAHKPVAFVICVQYAEVCQFIELGFDAEYRKFAPGAFLTYSIMIDCYIHNAPEVISLGFGENQYKVRLRTESSAALSAFLVPGGLAGAFTSLQRTLNIIEKKISTLLIKYHLDETIRRFLKRK